MLNPVKIKKEFPIFNRVINDLPLIYLDNAATSQKPQAVIDATVDYYSNHNANVGRGVYTLSEEATELYENSRLKIKEFIGASNKEEIVFTTGATEGINMVAYGFFLPRLHSGDTIVTTKFEHHSNLVPWQQIAKLKGCTIKQVDVDESGNVLLDQLEQALDGSVKVVAITHISNVLGNIQPIKKICDLAHKVSAYIVVDGSQAAGHLPLNMQSLGCDFYVFSGHKMYGPTGIGILYGKREQLDVMNPVKFGGGMINKVDLNDSTWAPSPQKFEAGTPNIAGAIGLGAAVDYINLLGIENIHKLESELTNYAIHKLLQVSGLQILGTTDASKRSSLISFYIEGIHSHDLASVLSNHNVCVRSGQHCAMPLHKALDINSSTRASFAIYNTPQDVDALVSAIWKAIEVLK